MLSLLSYSGIAALTVMNEEDLFGEDFSLMSRWPEKSANVFPWTRL